MDTQEHEYELGTLEEDILDRDESHARQSGNRGDERRWMILGGAGTLALLTALVAAVSLGGTSEPHRLSGTLPGPVRDLSAVAAHLQSAAPGTPSVDVAKPAAKPRIARHSAPAVTKQPPVATPVAPAKQAPAPPADPVSHAAVADTSSAFADLPTVSAVADDSGVDELAEPEEVVRTNFEQDADPFAEDASDEEPIDDAQGESDDESDDDAQDEVTEEEAADADAAADAPARAEAPAPVEVPAPAEAPAPVEVPTPADDVAADADITPPTPA